MTQKKRTVVFLFILDPELKRVREKVIEFDFSWIEIQGRSVKGNTLAAHKVDRVVNAPKLEEGASDDISIKKMNPIQKKIQIQMKKERHCRAKSICCQETSRFFIQRKIPQSRKIR